MERTLEKEAVLMELTASKLRTRDIAYIGIFAALIAICSWISVPTAIPFTLQTLGVFLAVGLLGGRRGTLAVLVYLLLGLVGLPVFAGFHGGPGALMTPSGGYLIGFLFSALLMWGIERAFGRRLPALGVSMVLGLLVCYAFGTVWFMVVYARTTGPVGVMSALGWCVFPFVVPDLVKLGLGVTLARRVKRYLK